MRLVVAFAAISLATPARADPAADANTALQAFVAGAAANKLPPGVDAWEIVHQHFSSWVLAP